MKFYLFAREDYCELSPEALQADEIKFEPSNCEKVLLKIDDPDYSPDDFKPGGKCVKHLIQGCSASIQLPINPKTIKVLKETSSDKFLNTDAAGTMFFFAFSDDTTTVLENMDDEEAILYYELN